MGSGAKQKLGFITTVALSLLTVFSASIATYAWFQATANVTIRAESVSTTITVNKPNDYVFYGYNGNIGSHTPNGTFSNDFTALTTATLVNEYTSFDAMSPGEIKVFAIGVSAASSVSLTLTEIVSNNAVKQNIRDGSSNLQHRYVYATDNYEINIGYAMDIFVRSETPANGSAPTGYTSFLTSTSGTDLFDYSIGTSADRTLLNSGTYASPEISTSISFFNNASLTTTNDLYIFWSVIFSDANAMHYNEVTSGGVALKEEPSTGNRYFTQSNTGNSNCFGGLDFALKAFTLLIG